MVVLREQAAHAACMTAIHWRMRRWSIWRYADGTVKYLSNLHQSIVADPTDDERASAFDIQGADALECGGPAMTPFPE